MRKTGGSDEEAIAARRYLAALIYDCLLAAPRPLRATEIARAVSDVAPVSARVVAGALERDPDFVAVERAWDLACRRDVQDRPIGGAIREILAACGKPLTAEAVCAQLAAAGSRPAAFFAVLVAQQASGSPDIVEIEPGLYGLRDWLLSGTDTDEATVRFVNGLDGSASLDAAARAVGRKHVKGRTPAATAAAILKVVGAPIAHKHLAFLAWQRHRKAKVGAELFGALLSRKDILLLRGPRWCTPQAAESLQERVAQLSEEEDRARGVAADFHVGRLLTRKPRSRKQFRVPAEAVDEAIAAIPARGVVGVDELLADILELYPGDAAFAAAARALARKLDRADEVVSVGFGKYCAIDAVPSAVWQVPAILAPAPPEAEEDEVLLSDRDLPAKLRELIHAPEKEDVGEEGEVKLRSRRKKLAEIVHAVPYHHLRAGTLKIRRIDRDIFPTKPDIVSATFEYHGEGVGVWLNNRAGLAYGLADWYERYASGPGVLVRISPTDAPGAYELRYDGETDPLVYIDQARTQALERLRARAEKSGLSVLTIMQTIMADHPEGVHFHSLVAEVNVVRRSRKRLIASHLCSSPRFLAVSGRPGVWRLKDEERPARRRRS